MIVVFGLVPIYYTPAKPIKVVKCVYNSRIKVGCVRDISVNYSRQDFSGGGGWGGGCRNWSSKSPKYTVGMAVYLGRENMALN